MRSPVSLFFIGMFDFLPSVSENKENDAYFLKCKKKATASSNRGGGTAQPGRRDKTPQSQDCPPCRGAFWENRRKVRRFRHARRFPLLNSVLSGEASLAQPRPVSQGGTRLHSLHIPAQASAGAPESGHICPLHCTVIPCRCQDKSNAPLSFPPKSPSLSSNRALEKNVGLSSILWKSRLRTTALASRGKSCYNESQTDEKESGIR